MGKHISEEKREKILKDFEKYKVQARVAKINGVSPGFVCKLVKDRFKEKIYED